MKASIDSHQHFWRFRPEEYGWIGEGMDVLRRDFLPGDVLTELRANGIDGSVAVQARQTMEETEWLLGLAEQNSFIQGVVGWAPLVAPNVQQELERFRENRKLKGARHLVQDEPDDNFILREDFNAGIRKLRQFELVYDVLIFERHLPQTIEFVDRHPGQVFVLDHIAKPKIRDAEVSPWREHIRELARRENVFCKISAMATEASWSNWSTQDLTPYFDVVLNAFGPNRLMFGSDWPVLLLAGSYGRWVETVHSLIARLSADEQADILGRTADRVYKLSVS